MLLHCHWDNDIFDCPDASKVTMEDMGKISWYQNTTRHNKIDYVHNSWGALYMAIVINADQLQYVIDIMKYVFSISSDIYIY